MMPEKFPKLMKTLNPKIQKFSGWVAQWFGLCGFNHWSRTEDPISHTVQPKKFF